MIILKLFIPILLAFPFVSCIEISTVTGGGGKGPGGGGSCLPWMPPSACVGGGGSGGGPALGPVHGQLVKINGNPGSGVYEIEVGSETWYLPVPPVNLGSPEPPTCSAAIPPVCDKVVITFGSGGKISKNP